MDEALYTSGKKKGKQSFMVEKQDDKVIEIKETAKEEAPSNKKERKNKIKIKRIKFNKYRKVKHPKNKPEPERHQQVEQVQELTRKKVVELITTKQEELEKLNKIAATVEDNSKCFQEVTEEMSLEARCRKKCCGFCACWRCCWYIGACECPKSKKTEKYVTQETTGKRKADVEPKDKITPPLNKGSPEQAVTTDVV